MSSARSRRAVTFLCEAPWDNPQVERALRVAYTIEQSWHRVPGGTGVAGIGMARALSRVHDVDLVGVAAFHRRRAPAAWEPPIEVRHLPLPRKALYELWHQLRRPPVELATGPVDVIHATANAIPPRSAPIVLTVHDLFFLHDPSLYTRVGRRFFVRGLELALKDADVVLAVSEATRRECLAAGFEEGRVRVVPLGVDHDTASDREVAEVRRAHGLTRPYVLWVGTIEPRKNLARLLEAARTFVVDHDLVLAGPGGWNEDLDALIRRSGISPRRVGFVSRGDLRALYAGADVFCFPSLMEGFGFPVLEAMVQKTPVVTSRGTATEEVAGDAAVLVDPLDPASIASGVLSLLEDQARAKELADRGAERAAAFTWENTADLIAAAYRDAAA